jgi:hypothetical protein
MTSENLRHTFFGIVERFDGGVLCKGWGCHREYQKGAKQHYRNQGTTVDSWHTMSFSFHNGRVDSGERQSGFSS